VTSAPVAVLTGGGSGIGAATAARLGRRGLHLVLLGRNLEALGAVAATLPGEPDVVPIDLADPDQVANCGEQIAGRYGEVAALVNCAGALLNRRAERASPADVARLLAVNATAPHLLAAALFPRLRAARGAVVNVVSVSALQGVAAQSGYSASKGALVALTRSLATEWGVHGIRVNGVAPGIIRTPMSAAFAGSAYEEYTARNVPLGRWGRPDDVAGVIEFLCSDDARYVTGQILTVDGGLSSLYWMSTAGAVRSEVAASESAPLGTV